jgi:hypothetical protein
MARIRTIKPEFWTDEKVVECSLPARLLFIGLWNFADDAGRLEDSPRQIKMKVFPGDDFTAAEIDGMLRELSGNGLVVRYSVDDKGYIFIKGWRHQVINKPQASKLPPPDRDNSGSPTGTLPVGMEGNGREDNNHIPPHPESSATPPLDEGRDDRIDEIRKIVWRQDGLSETQIETKLVGASGDGIRQVVAWLGLGLTAQEIADAITDAYDDAERRKQPIKAPWKYLDAVMRRIVDERDKPVLSGPIDPWLNPKSAKLRTSLAAQGQWPMSFGPEPGFAGCTAPPEAQEAFRRARYGQRPREIDDHGGPN